MLEAAEEVKQSAVGTIREGLRENIRVARLKHRQDEADNSRITLGKFEDYSANLQTYSTSDVIQIAAKIKKKRHASPSDLLKLNHAFLQSVENIKCFVNTSGAVPVIVKELTGTKTETQMLAVECLCNLSLGSEVDCEKIAQRAGTYLHTFLQSSNESLAKTSLWCLTNLIAAGKKPLNILLSQELIKALINTASAGFSQSLKQESCIAIELVLDHGGVPRPSDVETLSKWILSESVPLDLGVTKIVYKLLNLLEFQSNDAVGLQKLVHMCFDTLIYLHDNSFQPTTSGNLVESNESLHQAVILMRISSNIVALGGSFGDYIVDSWFRSQNRSLASFFNRFIDLFSAHGLLIDEINWFIGNLMKCQLNELNRQYLEVGELILLKN